MALPDGGKPTPIYIRRAGSLACSRHALIPIQTGSIIIYASHHRRDFYINVSRVVSINEEEATLEKICVFREGEWAPDVPNHLFNAVEAARKKATTYHCRYAVYVEEQPLKDRG